MGCNPTVHVLRKEGFYVSIQAVGKDPHKDVCRDNFSCVPVDNTGGISCPVHLDLLSRSSLDMHGGAPFFRILLIMETEPGIHERQFIALPAILTVLIPEKL
jgi:hypothetical protein